MKKLREHMLEAERQKDQTEEFRHLADMCAWGQMIRETEPAQTKMTSQGPKIRYNGGSQKGCQGPKNSIRDNI